jgi:hypothetical protein
MHYVVDNGLILENIQFIRHDTRKTDMVRKRGKDLYIIALLGEIIGSDRKNLFVKIAKKIFNLHTTYLWVVSTTPNNLLKSPYIGREIKKINSTPNSAYFG